jgi:tetrahydromethanopterin S-methyltransferase subunit F
MLRKRKRPVPELPSAVPRWRQLITRREKVAKFVARHAVAGFLTGAGSAVGMLVVKLWLQ